MNNMGNPLLQMLMGGMRQNANPMQMLGQICGGNPQIRSAMQLISGKSPQQLEQVARNLYRERGLDINQAAQQMGLRL